LENGPATARAKARASWTDDRIPHPGALQAGQPLADSIAQCLAPIDAVLSELIAPDGRTFTLEALIADHGHPTEDYSDLEWAEEEAFWRAAFGDDEEDSEA
jgi:hypothetical protein